MGDQGPTFRPEGKVNLTLRLLRAAGQRRDDAARDDNGATADQGAL
jgi:hypothetical protein